MPGRRRRTPDDLDRGRRLKAWRESKTWGVTDLARKLKVSRQQIYKWQRGGYMALKNSEGLRALGFQLQPQPPTPPPLSAPRSGEQNKSLDWYQGWEAGYQEGQRVGMLRALGNVAGSTPSGS